MWGIKIPFSSSIHRGVKFFHIGNVTVGNHSVINFGCYLDNRRRITIGNNVGIAHDTKIYTLGHDIHDPQFKTEGREVTIKDDVFIFSNVLIMPGVTIDEGSIVLPGSVVTRDVQPFTIVGGNSAGEIGKRGEHIDYKINYNYWLAL
jgi:maltose O-acetyltransferase